MSSTSESEDDIPLSKIAAKRKSEDEDEDSDEEEEAEFEDDEEDSSDDDDDLPVSSLSPSAKKGSKTKGSVSKKVASSESSHKAKKKTEKSSSSKASSAKKKKKTQKDSVSSNGGGSSNFVCASSELYSKSEKGKLVQALLCRWWYTVTWPDPTLPTEPPKNCDSLDGFPGVYVYTKGESVGKLLDLRDKSTSPNFINFALKPAEELQSLLLTAIQKQKVELIQHEGKGTATEKALDNLAKWAAKLNTRKAEKDASKVLKAANLTLPQRSQK